MARYPVTGRRFEVGTVDGETLYASTRNGLYFDFFISPEGDTLFATSEYEKVPPKRLLAKNVLEAWDRFLRIRPAIYRITAAAWADMIRRKGASTIHYQPHNISELEEEKRFLNNKLRNTDHPGYRAKVGIRGMVEPF